MLIYIYIYTYIYAFEALRRTSGMRPSDLLAGRVSCGNLEVRTCGNLDLSNLGRATCGNLELSFSGAVKALLRRLQGSFCTLAYEGRVVIYN
jgi:hypothetical protein